MLEPAPGLKFAVFLEPVDAIGVGLTSGRAPLGRLLEVADLGTVDVDGIEVPSSTNSGCTIASDAKNGSPFQDENKSADASLEVGGLLKLKGGVVDSLVELIGVDGHGAHSTASDLDELLPGRAVLAGHATVWVGPKVKIGVDTLDREANGQQVLGDGFGVIADTAAAHARQDDHVDARRERLQGNASASTVLADRLNLDAVAWCPQPTRGGR